MKLFTLTVLAAGLCLATPIFARQSVYPLRHHDTHECQSGSAHLGNGGTRGANGFNGRHGGSSGFHHGSTAHRWHNDRYGGNDFNHRHKTSHSGNRHGGEGGDRHSGHSGTDHAGVHH